MGKKQNGYLTKAHKFHSYRIQALKKQNHAQTKIYHYTIGALLFYYLLYRLVSLLIEQQFWFVQA